MPAPAQLHYGGEEHWDDDERKNLLPDPSEMEFDAPVVEKMRHVPLIDDDE